MLLDRQRVKFWQKIVFGGLAFIFAASFVIGGVGSGTNFSLADIFNNGGGSSSGNSTDVDSLLSQSKKQPNNATVWSNLGSAYDQQGSTDQAIKAYQRALKLAPNNADALQGISSVYLKQGNVYLTQAQSLQQQAYTVQSQSSPSSDFTPGGAFGTALQGQLEQAETSQVNAQITQLSQQATVLQAQASSWYTKAVAPYAKLAKLKPDDPFTWIQYGTVARQAGDTAKAKLAYQTFLKKFPDDPSAGDVKALVKQLDTSGSTGG